VGKEPREIEREIEATRERVGDDVEALATKVDVPGRAKGYAADKTESLRSGVSSAKDVVSAAPSRATERLGSGVRKGANMAERNPLAMVAGAAAAGVIAGALLPTSRAEEERIAPVAGRVKDQARTIGEDLIEHGRQVATDTVDAAGEAVKSATDAARDSAKRHGEEVKDTMPSTSASADAPATMAPGTTGTMGSTSGTSL